MAIAKKSKIILFGNVEYWVSEGFVKNDVFRRYREIASNVNIETNIFGISEFFPIFGVITCYHR